MVWGIFKELWIHHNYLIPEHFFHLNLKACAHQQSLPTHLQSLTTTNLISDFMNMPLLDISYKWSHRIYSHLYLTSFTQNVQYSFVLWRVSAEGGMAWRSGGHMGGEPRDQPAPTGRELREQGRMSKCFYWRSGWSTGKGHKGISLVHLKATRSQSGRARSRTRDRD